MKDLARDARFGLRLLARSPGFAAAVVVALGLGIGSATAIWSGVRAVALAPLPYPDSDRLMFVSRAYPGFPQGGGNFSYPALADIASWNRSFDVFAGYQAYGALALSGGQEPVRLNVNWVAPAYLELLGLRPELGRALRASEDRYVDGDPVVVLSHDVWQRQFGGSPNIVGAELVLNDRTFTVVGVAPPEFRDAPAEQELGEPIEAWVPLGLAHEVLGQFGPQDRAGAILWALARRKPGVSVAQARADVAGLGQKMARVYPATDRGFGLVARPLKDQLVGELYAPLRLLGAGALFLLLIGCANAGNLLLARLLTRQREFAVRAAHGATSRRLAAQVVVENLLLALASGALGLALASAGVEALRHGVAGGLSPVVRFALDGRLVLAGVALTLATGLLVGLLPAVLRSRAPLTDALNQGGRSAAPSVRQTTVRALVAGEVALALVLLAGAGLLWKSVRNLTTWDLGFRTENLLTLRLDLRSQRYTDPESRARFGRQVAEDLGRVPGAASVTLWGPSMLGRATWVIEARNEGAARRSIEPGHVVSPQRQSGRARESRDRAAPRARLPLERRRPRAARRDREREHGEVRVARPGSHRQALSGAPPSGLGHRRRRRGGRAAPPAHRSHRRGQRRTARRARAAARRLLPVPAAAESFAGRRRPDERRGDGRRLGPARRNPSPRPRAAGLRHRAAAGPPRAPGAGKPRARDDRRRFRRPRACARRARASTASWPTRWRGARRRSASGGPSAPRPAACWGS